MAGQKPDSQALETSQRVADLVFGPKAERTINVRYWNSGVVDGAANPDARVTVVLTHPGAFRRLLLPPSELRMAEAVLHGDVEVEGDLEAAAMVGLDIRRRLASPRDVLRLFRLLFALPAPSRPHSYTPRMPWWRRVIGRHSEERDAVAVRSHYDIGNDFYALWLDQNMVYSCGYFEHGNEDLDAAQLAKLDYICRKLRLKPGERLLDIGCGWGGLVRHAASNYGVTALGVTLSEEQARVARERIAAEGLSDRCEIQVRDYRTLGSLPPFDKVASIGMAEHVGGSELPTYVGTAYRLTKPGGLFLLHSIIEGRPRKARLFLLPWREGKFTDRYVFPDGELVPLHALQEIAYRTGYETRDVESLREHYALTLRAWTRRLEAAKEFAMASVGAITYRIWRLSMAGAAGNFANGKHNIVQMLLARPLSSGAIPGLPATRRDLYAARRLSPLDRVMDSPVQGRDPADRRAATRPRAPTLSWNQAASPGPPIYRR